MHLREFLETSHVTDREFAERIGVALWTVRRYLNGDRLPERDVMDRIHVETGGLVTANDFYGHEPVPAPQPERVMA